ncbi:MAG: VWA domain-containing protein [Vicinamibacterales bacterium]
MSRRASLPVAALTGLVLAIVAATGASRPAAQQPVFKSGVELIAVDVAIVDKKGNPVTGLRPEQFEVTIDGKPRRVVSAEFVEFAPLDAPAAAKPVASRAIIPAYSSNEQITPTAPQGRLIFLAVDQGSFRNFNARGAMEAARRFIDRLQPEDRIGLVAFPGPGPSVPASRDHAAARAATAQIIGRATPFRADGLDKNVSLSEALDIHGGDAMTTQIVLARECGGFRSAGDRKACEEAVRTTAISIGRNAEIQSLRSLAGIEAIIRSLAPVRERKTLVLISAGLPVSDRSGINLQLTSSVTALGREAAAANLNFFVLHVDSGFLDAFSAEERTMSDTLYRDLGIMSSGLETISGAAGGSLFQVFVGADLAFERVLRETAAAYLLGVEPIEGDRDGKAHRISVKVKSPGAEVRSRREVVVPAATARASTPEDALGAALRASRLDTALPIRLATFIMAPDAEGRRQILLSADIGGNASGPADIWVAYTLTDASGRTQPPVGRKLRLRPRAGSFSGALSFAEQIAIGPGRHTLRFAAVDAQGRAGSLDHGFSADLVKGEGAAMGDVLLLEPLTGEEQRLEVATDGRLRGDAIDAYIELVPADPDAFDITVRFDVADGPDREPLVTETGLMTRTPGSGHWSATARLDLTDFPPGDYVVVATVSAGERPLGRAERAFHIGPSAR